MTSTPGEPTVNNEHIRTIEVDGIKLEVDLRTAKKIDTYKVGDRVKVLIKSYSGYETHPGAIIAIDCFKKLPTVVVAYIKGQLSGAELGFAYLNSESKDTEICPMTEDDLIPTRDTIIAEFDKSLAKKRTELEDIAEKREWFLRKFGVTFSNAVAEASQEALD